MGQIALTWTINIMGALVITKNGDRVENPPPLPSAVLTCLALAGKRGMRTHELLNSVRDDQRGRAIRSENALQKHLTTLRNDLGMGDALPKLGALAHEGYALDFTRVGVDSAGFLEAMNRLPDNPTVGNLGELLAYWRHDPRVTHAKVHPDRWRTLFQSRSTLLSRINAVDPTDVPGLAEFIDLFPGDPECGLLRSRLTVREDKRLLVVEDLNLDLIVEALDGYDCVPVPDYTAWRRLLDENPEKIHGVHGALIDLHLTAGLRDNDGLRIAEWLRDNTEIPAALVTMAPPATPDLADWNRTQQSEYRLVKIVHKGHGEIDTDVIREAAKALTSDEDKYVRQRQRTWVSSARWQVKNEYDDLRTRRAEERLNECRREAAGVFRVIDREPLADAKREVRRFVARWGTS